MSSSNEIAISVLDPNHLELWGRGKYKTVMSTKQDNLLIKIKI